MNAIPTPLWRCKSCDNQFDEPEIWPGERRPVTLVTDPEDRDETFEEIKVCPRCHSTAIERWQ